jgi:hypothetical protein
VSYHDIILNHSRLKIHSSSSTGGVLIWCTRSYDKPVLKSASPSRNYKTEIFVFLSFLERHRGCPAFLPRRSSIHRLEYLGKAVDKMDRDDPHSWHGVHRRTIQFSNNFRVPQCGVPWGPCMGHFGTPQLIVSIWRLAGRDVTTEKQPNDTCSVYRKYHSVAYTGLYGAQITV